jgi:UDP-glucose 4-epimerase
VCTIVGKRRIAMPPLLTNIAAEPLRMLRVVNLPPEMLDLLRFGRGLDNRRYKQAGFRYRYSTTGTIEAFAQGRRLERTVGSNAPSYRYEREVEDFFRHSPAVLRQES